MPAADARFCRRARRGAPFGHDRLEDATAGVAGVAQEVSLRNETPAMTTLSTQFLRGCCAGDTSC